MESYNYNGSTEYEKAFLGDRLHLWLLKKDWFAELREAFQALSRSEQDIFLMAQLKAMNGGEITAGRCLKRKHVLI